jgi:outer membrane protein assembly factor BamB
VAIDGLGVFAYGNVISARRLTDGSQAWQRKYPGAGSPAGEVGGLWAWHGELIALIAPVYLGERPVPMYVQALNPATGAVRWTASLGPGQLYNDQVITSSGVLAVLTETGGAGGLGKLMAFDLNTHHLLWTRPYGKNELTEGPTAAGPVIVMVGNGTVTAFDTRTGAVRWAHGGIRGGVESLAGPGNTVLLYDLLPQLTPAQAPYPPSRLFPVTAFNAATGAVRWRAKAVGGTDEVSVLRNGMIVVGTSGPARLTLLRPTGQAVWSVPENVENGVTLLATGTDLFYVSSNSGVGVPTRLVDRRLSTGAVRWSTSLGDDSSAQIDQLAGGNLIVTEELGLNNPLIAARAINPATGHVRASAPLVSPPTTAATAGRDTLLELAAGACPGAAVAPGAGGFATSTAGSHP